MTASATPTPYDIQQLIDAHFAPLIYQTGLPPSGDRAPGGVCGIYYEGETYYQPLGMIDTSGTPPDENTIFGIGSVTKVLTTSIVGQQSDTVLKSAVKPYLPPGYGLMPGEEEVTFADLATFTGGINPSAPPGKFDNCTQAEFQAFINTMDPDRIPSANQYSDSSIGFLAQIVMGMAGYTTFTADTTGVWFSDNLLTALSMTRTGTWRPPFNADWASYAFNFADGAYQPVSYEPWVPWGAAGRVYSTCADMMNFVQANVGVSQIGGKTISQTILDGMQTAQEPWAPPEGNGYWRQAFAWMIFKSAKKGVKFCGKAGGVTGVNSFITVCKDEKLGVVILTNMRGTFPETAAKAITEGLIAL